MTGAPALPLATDVADLWFLESGALEEPAAANPWLARLEPHERRRHDALRSPAARRDFLATRALARTALAHYSGQPAERLRFGTDPLRRPEVISPALPDLSFNLANTSGLAAGLFASGHEVGVDVELVAPIAAAEIAARFFSLREAAEVAALEEAARLSRFYELWTLREAYLKARGVGLTLPLEQLAFQPTASGEADAQFGPAIGDDPARWQFGLVWLTERHLAATCVRRPDSGSSVAVVRFDAGTRVAAITKQPSR